MPSEPRRRQGATGVSEGRDRSRAPRRRQDRPSAAARAAVADRPPRRQHPLAERIQATAPAAGQAAIAAARPVPRSHVGYDVLKRVIDIAGAVVGLVLGLPLMAAIAVAVLIDSGRPVLYRARRVGQGGRDITVLKFRTMRPDSEAILAQLLLEPMFAMEFSESYKLRDDPRCTRLGRLLRRTSLDELPQLWNVLRGSMSLVGPRPIVEDELPKYRAIPAGEASYLAVKPGITGLWQVSGRNDTTYEERVELDIAYVRGRSIRGDLAILVKTPRAALRGHGAY